MPSPISFIKILKRTTHRKEIKRTEFAYLCQSSFYQINQKVYLIKWVSFLCGSHLIFQFEFIYHIKISGSNMIIGLGKKPEG